MPNCESRRHLRQARGTFLETSVRKQALSWLREAPGWVEEVAWDVRPQMETLDWRSLRDIRLATYCRLWLSVPQLVLSWLETTLPRVYGQAFYSTGGEEQASQSQGACLDRSSSRCIDLKSVWGGRNGIHNGEAAGRGSLLSNGPSSLAPRVFTSQLRRITSSAFLSKSQFAKQQPSLIDWSER